MVWPARRAPLSLFAANLIGAWSLTQWEPFRERRFQGPTDLGGHQQQRMRFWRRASRGGSLFLARPPSPLRLPQNCTRARLIKALRPPLRTSRKSPPPLVRPRLSKPRKVAASRRTFQTQRWPPALLERPSSPRTVIRGDASRRSS